MVTYFLTILIITVLLISAVIVNISLCGRNFKAPNRRPARTANTPHLHDVIFG